MKIGIFGGSFNPVHKKHIRILVDILDNSILDKIYISIAGGTYNKKGLIDYNNRLEMVKIALDNLDDKYKNKIEIANLETDNNSLYTYQILDYFKNKYNNDEIYFVMGADNLLEFDTWKEFRYMYENYNFIVLERNDTDLDKYINDLKEKYVVKNIECLYLNNENISSTEIRKMIKENDIEKVNECIDNEVYNYIKEKNLYID